MHLSLMATLSRGCSIPGSWEKSRLDPCLSSKTAARRENRGAMFQWRGDWKSHSWRTHRRNKRKKGKEGTEHRDML